MSNATHAVDLVIQGLSTLVEALKKIDHRDEWVDQNHSPIGKRAHLEAVRRGLVKGSKIGRLTLIQRGDLDDYIAAYRVNRVTVDEARDEAAEIEALINAEPRRRRRASERKG